MMVTMSFDAMSYTSNQGYLLLNNHQQLLGISWFMNVLGNLKLLILHYGLHDLM